MFLDDNQNVIGVSYSSPVMALSRSCDPSKVCLICRMSFAYSLFNMLLNTSMKIKGPISVQTRFKIADSMMAQSIPIQAIGPRPGHLKDVNLDMEGDVKTRPATPQSFLRKYVSRGSAVFVLAFKTNCHYFMQWYIVIMLMIYMVMGGGGDDKKGGAGTADAAAAGAPSDAPSS